MLRFRMGQRWKDERGAPPKDAFGLLLDGVDILAGANEEALLKVVPELCDAVLSLCGGGHLAQVSLSDAHLELLLERVGVEARLEVVSLLRPARRVRGPVTVELEELIGATLACAQALIDDVSTRLPKTDLRVLKKQLHALERSSPPPVDGKGRPFETVVPAEGETAFSFKLRDLAGRVFRYIGRGAGALGSLLFDGELELHHGGKRVFSAKGPLFLLALELSRQAQDLVHALELSDRSFKLQPAGVGATLTLDLLSEKPAIPPHALTLALFNLGQELSHAIVAANKAQAKNPYLVELVARCREGIAQLRALQPTAKGTTPIQKRRAPRKPASERPIARAGKLRKLQFTQRWASEPLGAELSPRLVLTSSGPTVSSAELAMGFDVSGKPRFRYASTRGVAVSAEGHVVTATSDRLLAFDGRAGAVWMRDHDGTQVGPSIIVEGNHWLTLGNGRTLLALEAHTGREAYRLNPSRTQRSYLSLSLGRALLTTDRGHLFGVSLTDGTVVYRLRASHGFEGPVAVWGKRAVMRVGAGGQTAISCAEAETGALHWTAQLPLSRPSAPLPVGDRLYVAGGEPEEATLYCLSKKGETLWRRKLHIAHGPWTLSAVKRQVLLTSRAGAAALVDPDGRVVWRNGAPADDELAGDVAPAFGRGVVVVPGPTVRAMDLRSGQVLAELSAGAQLRDLAVDKKLSLYLLDDDGGLSAWDLSSHLAVL